MDQTPTPTPREQEILKVHWDPGPRTLRDVHRELTRQEPELAYNTVQTLLRIMDSQKGLVRHHAEGRSFIYTACFTREASTASFLDRVFDGAASQLVQSLLRSERVSAEELDRMQALISAARRKNGRG